MLVDLVHKYGPKNWSCIAKFLPGRIGKQCRERYAFAQKVPQPFGSQYKERQMDRGGGYDHHRRSQALRQPLGSHQQVPPGPHRQRHKKPLEQHHQEETETAHQLTPETQERPGVGEGPGNDGNGGEPFGSAVGFQQGQFRQLLPSHSAGGERAGFESGDSATDFGQL